MCGPIREGFLRMRDRYGARGAVAVLLSVVALAAVPIPGMCLLPVYLAELAKRSQGLVLQR